MFKKGENMGASNPAHRPEVREKKRLAFSGAKSHFWKGGIVTEEYRQRRVASYKDFKKAVKERDNNSCQNCGATKDLCVHHIKSFIKFPELRLEPSNAKTLCNDCHRLTEDYGKHLRNQS